MNRFRRFVAGLNLTDFTASELLTKTDRTHNHEPPERIWPNVAPTILVLQKLRTEFDIRITLTSVYRSYEYNRRLRGSARRSQHTAFNAIDFVPARRAVLDDMAETLIDWRGQWISSPERFDRAEVIVEERPVPTADLQWKQQGDQWSFMFKGGVSLYSNFIHVDTRGYDANW